MLSQEQRRQLLDIAREAIMAHIENREVKDWIINDERLNFSEGAFVTLHKGDQLRGCIGLITVNDRPLWQTVRDMAFASANEDPRFLPVTVDELNEIKIEISVLSVPKEISNWRNIELGKHGVIVSRGQQSGVFLPQVATETGWDTETFLSELCSQKAGLQPNAYKNDAKVKLEVFTAEIFSEKG